MENLNLMQPEKNLEAIKARIKALGMTQGQFAFRCLGLGSVTNLNGLLNGRLNQPALLEKVIKTLNKYENRKSSKVA